MENSTEMELDIRITDSSPPECCGGFYCMSSVHVRLVTHILVLLANNQNINKINIFVN